MKAARVMKALTFFVLLWAHFLCNPKVTYALSEELKQLVQNDCAAAWRTLPTLKAEERSELGDYLLFLLEVPPQTLKLADLGTGLQPAGLPAPAPESFPRELLQLMEFAAQQRAQACALYLLPRLLPESMNFLPRLCALTAASKHASPLNPKLNKELMQLTAALAMAGSGTAYASVLPHCGITSPVQAELSTPFDWRPSPELMRQLIHLLTGSTQSCAERVLVELQEWSRPAIVEAALQTGLKQQNMLLRLLAGIGLQDEFGAQVILDLCGAEDPSLRLWALTEMQHTPSPLARRLPALVERLVDPEKKVSDKAFKLLHDLADDLLQTPLKPALTENHYKILCNELLSDSTDQRRTAFKILEALSPLPPSIEKMLSEGLNKLDADGFAMRLLAVARLFPISASSLNLILRAIDQDSPEVKYTALVALSFLPQVKDKIPPYLLRILKQNSIQKDKNKQIKLIYAAAETIYRLDLGPIAPSTLPYLVPALDFPTAWKIHTDEVKVDWIPSNFEESSLARVFISTPLAAAPILLRALPHAGALLRQRVAWLLGELKYYPHSVLQALSSLLKDPENEVSRAAAESLKRAGKAARPWLNRIMLGGDTAARLAAAMLLVEIEPQRQDAAKILREAITKQNCTKKKVLATALNKLGSETQAWVQSEMLKCIEEAEDGRGINDYLKSIFPPLCPQAQEQLKALLLNPNLAPKTKIALLEQGLHVGLPEEILIPELIGALGYVHLRIKALQLLGALGGRAEAALPDLLSLWQDSRQPAKLRHLLAATIFRISPQAINYKEFFQEALKTDTYELASEAAIILGAQAVLPFLQEALTSASIKERINAVKCLARLGKDALPAAADLLKLMRSSEDKSSYAAMMALLQIGVQNDEIAARLRTALLSLEWELLRKEHVMPHNLRGLLEHFISSDPCKFIRFRANLLFRRIPLNNKTL